MIFGGLICIGGVMPIWKYSEYDILTESMIQQNRCMFCNIRMKNIYKESVYKKNKEINICPICGWWYIAEQELCTYRIHGNYTFNCFGVRGTLKRLDLIDVNQPIQDIENYLKVKYEDRYNVHPKIFEDVVGSVFRNIGYISNVTAYSQDGGIDVILYNCNGDKIGVQVKRYKNSIRVSQIREFLGALIENGMTRGIFVTTSRFQKGVSKSVEKFSKQKYKIELIDGDKFLDLLKISHIEQCETYEEFIDIYGDIKSKMLYANETEPSFII